MSNETVATYDVISVTNVETYSPPFPSFCPRCKAPAADLYVFNGYQGFAKYACGGSYTYLTQIQNHTNRWTGHCPVTLELAGLQEAPADPVPAPTITFGEVLKLQEAKDNLQSYYWEHLSGKSFPKGSNPIWAMNALTEVLHRIESRGNPETKEAVPT